ncbi:MAG: ATP-dependent RNA helicase HrpA [Labilithrix sp.]|nr:ATP-dependent RNA helicase HrpA [Labilithrix sp.]
MSGEPPAFTSSSASAHEGDRSPIVFPPELPISARVADIATAIDRHPVVIVAGATGSGKTTQLPKIALAMGRGLERIIGVTQPRRIAATSVAARVASELGSPLGTDVGYQIRFDDRTSASTYVKFMTDGILLAEIHGDPLLRRYDTLIIDEAHERSLTIDFLLGWVKRILPERPDLKVVVSSATLETERFSEFFGGAPVIEVEGRTFPVDVLYEPPADDVDLPDAIADAVANVTSLDPRGDILVFLPGEREIREAENALLARGLRHTVVQPLYARLSASDQSKVFASIPQRRVILATNVAETSVTIPGIVYVVDAGIARLSRYDPRSGTTRLQIEGISQASADQRKGRCGRVRDGICVRLYDEQSFAARPAFTDPEIKRTGLAGVILRMKALGLGDVEGFSFLDPPHSKAVTEGYRVLEELGALGERRELTPLGERLARFPVDPRVGRMILAGADLGCLREVLVIAAALVVQDPRERPREAQQKADELHRRFRDERSDFVALLRLWDFVKEAERKGTSNLRRVCRDGFLSFIRVREWGEIHRQLEEIVRELRIDPRAPDRGAGRQGASRDRGGRGADGGADGAPRGKTGRGGGASSDDALHRALLTGLLSKVGTWNPEQRVFIGAKQTRFAIHPSSALARKPPAWVMAFELVETSQLFARMVAKIEPDSLLEAAPHLLKRSYADPHWSERSARASVREHATLFGLSIARDRSVDYASVAPAEARRMFLDHALVRGEYASRGAFQKKNQELLAEVARLRDKARRSDMLADDDALLDFFDRKVPADVVDGKTFEAWRERAEGDDPGALHLSLEDVFTGDRKLSAADYPDAITLHGATLPVSYRFDPSADDDGITVTIPLVLLPQLEPGELDWTIPGWHEEKLAALLYELPRAHRREIGDVPEVARALASRLTPFVGPMIPAVARALAEVTGASVPEDAFRPDAVGAYLRLTCRVVDHDRKVVEESRDVGDLLKRHGARARAAWKASAPAPRWERKGIASWDFGELAPFVVRRVAGQDVRSYPALEDRGGAVDLVLLESQGAAEVASRAGVRRLLMIAVRQTISAIAPRLPAAFARPNGATASRAETEAFRSLLLARIVDTAFRLDGDAPLPRGKAAFDALVAAGAPRLDPAFRVYAEALKPIAGELDRTLTALRNASKHPSGRNAVVDLYAQLEHLFPLDLVGWVPLGRLEHYPRYLRAAQARLQRAVSDPRKDGDKHAPFAPLWSSFLAKRAAARDQESARELRWAFEELRVAIFAPELKTPVPVSVTKVAAALAALR